jgi:5'-3' exonuclease
MTSTNYILLDTSYFIFYRFYALIGWWKLAQPDVELNNPIENEIKDYKLFAALDCPRKDIWRNSLFDKYKENREYDDTFMGGPFFKLGKDILKELDIQTLYHERLEADDCNALTCKYIRSQLPDSNIYIIANDMDYLQLASANVKIINLKYQDLTTSKKWSGNAEQDLFCKIVIGDKSDDIPGIFKKCGPKTAMKYFNDNIAFQKQLKIENAYERYEKNKKLVDFNEIPEDLILEFMVNLNIK